jgi:hypothetical protein
VHISKIQARPRRNLDTSNFFRCPPRPHGVQAHGKTAPGAILAAFTTAMVGMIGGEATRGFRWGKSGARSSCFDPGVVFSGGAGRLVYGGRFSPHEIYASHVDPRRGCGRPR